LSFFDRWRGLHWNPPWDAGWLFVILALGLVAYAIYTYRKTEAPMGAGYRGLLAGLRALALVTLVAILCRPVVSLAVASGAAKGVLVLLDRSESVTLPGGDPGTTRDQELARATAGVEKELGGSYPLSFRPFAVALGPEIEDPASVPPADGAGTDLAAALDQGMAQGGPSGRPGAMILISDGTSTEGPDPVPLARRMGIPIQTVGLGSADPVPDLAVVRLQANREAFTGERTPIGAVLRLQGLPAASVRVRLLDVTDNPVELDGVDARLEPGGAEKRVGLSFIPAKPGLRFLEVVVPGLDGEATGANNRRMVAVTVREEKTGVLLLTGTLTWDHTFLRRALDADSTLAVSAGFWRDGSFRPVAGGRPLPPVSASGLRDVRLVVLDHVRPGQLGPKGTGALAEFVRRGGGLYVVSGGEAGDLGAWRGTPLDALLPVVIESRPGDAEAQLRLTATGRRSPLFDPTAPGAPPLDAWADLPPVAVSPELGSAKGNAETLMAADQEGTTRPVLSWVRAGQGRVLLFAGAGMWRWGFGSSDQEPSRGVMAGWWRRAAHWLARPDVETRLDIHPEDYVVPRGKPVSFVARVTDEAYRPVTDADVEVSVTPEAGSTEEPRTVALGGGEGIMSGVIENLPPGRYRYEGKASSRGKPLGTVDGVFAVDSLGTEMERLEADPEVLARVADAAGGRFWRPDSLAGMRDAFRTITQAEEERVQVALWDSPWMFVAFVLFASAEWLLRRRRGLV
jgi:hypothetical protein